MSTPPYSNITGIFTTDDKHHSISRAEYIGSARPGQLIVDTTDYSLWIGTASGEMISAAGGGANGTGGSPISAGTVTVNAQPNITSVGTLAVLDVTGNVTSGNVSTGNVTATGTVIAGNVRTINIISTGNVTSGNITSSGNVTVTGNVTSGNVSTGNVTATGNVSGTGGVFTYVTGNGANLTAINGANITGNVTSAITANFANYAGNVTVAAQPNITSVGALTGLTVNGITNLGPNSNLRITGGTTGQVLSTDGSGTLSWTTVSAGSGVSNGTSSTQVNASNITTVIGGTTIQTIAANGVTITGNANVSGNVNASYFIGNGSQLTALSGANVVGNVTSAVTANFANYAGNVTVAAQPNITSVGTLTGLAVNGTTSLGLVGNVSITGGTTGQVLTTNGSGVLTWSTISSSGASNGTSSTQVNASNITTVIGGTTIQTIAANGVTITGNANVSGNVNASYFIGNGSQLTDIAGANVVGNVTSAITANFANYAGNVTVAAQPNITSVGTLTSLAVGGTTNLGAIGNVTITGGTTGQVLSTDGSGVLAWQTVAAGGATTLGQLTGVDSEVDDPRTANDFLVHNGTSWVAGSVEIGQLSDVSTSLTNVPTDGKVLTWDAATLKWIPKTITVAGASVVGNVTSAITANFANFAGNVTVAAQPNITSVGTLTSLTVTGNTTSGNFTTAGKVTTANLYSKNFTTEAKAQTTTTVIDFAQSVQQFTVSSARAFTTSNVPATGTVGSVSLILVVSAGAGTSVTWPTGTKWPGGTAPTLANGTHVISLLTYDGGTTYLGAALEGYA